MPSKLRIAVLSRDRSLIGRMELRLQSRGYQVVPLADAGAVRGLLSADPPDLVIADMAADGPGTAAVIRELKQGASRSRVPVIGILPPVADGFHDAHAVLLDDFITHPVQFGELFSRIELSQQRRQRVLDDDPLTKLPGNTSIRHAIEKALGRPMAVCCIDINHFKSYNDTYGFDRGDDVIRMVARIMENAVRDAGGGFAGHAGGDDFVFVVPLDTAEEICKTITANFTVAATEIFSEEEKLLGTYVARDRKGREQQVPLLGIAIAVVPTDTPQMTHAGRVAAAAEELRKFAERSPGSTYVIDRRKEAL